MDIQRQIRRNAQETQASISDLHAWEEKIAKKDKELKSKPSVAKKLPPIRGTVAASSGAGKSRSGRKKRRTGVKVRKVVGSSSKRDKGKEEVDGGEDGARKSRNKLGAYDYAAWEKFDVDAELARVDGDDGGRSNSKKKKGKGSLRIEEIEYEYEYEYESADDEEDGKGKDTAATDGAAATAAATESPDALKAQGNTAFAAADYPTAIDWYTKAMDADPSNAIYPANRSMAHLKLNNYDDAIRDATRSIALNPSYPKSFARRATAYEAKGILDKAKSDFDRAVMLAPSVKEYATSLARVIRKRHANGIPSDPAQPAGTAPVSTSTPASAHAPANDDDDDDKDDEFLVPVKITGEPAPSVPFGEPTNPTEPAQLDELIASTTTTNSKLVEMVESGSADDAEPEPEQEPEPEPSTPAKPEPSTPVTVAKALPKRAGPTSEDLVPPTSMYEFQRVWTLLDPAAPEAFPYLLQVAPPTYAKFFNTQLTEPLFVKMVDAVTHALANDATAAAAVEYAAAMLNHIVTVPRFGMIAMFLPASTNQAIAAIAAAVSADALGPQARKTFSL